MARAVRLCKLESVFVVSFSVTFQPQSHLWCSGVREDFDSCRGNATDHKDNPLRILWLWLILTESTLAHDGFQSAKSFLRLQLAQ